MRSTSFATFITLCSIFLITSVRGADVVCPEDPYLDPKNDECNPLKYISSLRYTGIAVGMILQVAVVQTLCTWKWGAKWMLPMTIGAYTFSIGLATRFGLHYKPESKGLYILEEFLVVLSPCAFIAAEYILLGRLARYLKCEEYLLINPRKITRFFVASDIITFLVQAAGGGLAASVGHPSLAKLGAHVFLAGLILQLISFLVFICLYSVFIHRIYARRPETWVVDKNEKWYCDWRALAGAFAVSCVGVVVRSLYRVIELSQGFEGSISANQILFYCLDTLPLFFAIGVYIPFWPGRFIPAFTAYPPQTLTPSTTASDRPQFRDAESFKLMER